MPGTLKLSNSSSAKSGAKSANSYGGVNIGGISLPGYSVATPGQGTNNMMMVAIAAVALIIIFRKK